VVDVQPRNGPVALVTGAAKRVGRAIVLELADAGYDLAIHYHASRVEATELADSLSKRGRRVVTVPGDLADPACPAEIVEQVHRQLGRLDVLINNAAVFAPDPAGGFAAEHWHRTIQVNAIAPAALIEAAADLLAAGGQGKVVNLCDISAERPWRGHLAYCASKAALVSLTRAYARTLAPRVQVNGVSPGIAAFPDSYPDDLRRRLVARVPLEREGSPEDIARTVRFLVEHGHYITGQIINVDGGRSIV
jgi:pteridine reductase